MSDGEQEEAGVGTSDHIGARIRSLIQDPQAVEFKHDITDLFKDYLEWELSPNQEEFLEMLWKTKTRVEYWSTPFRPRPLAYAMIDNIAKRQYVSGHRAHTLFLDEWSTQTTPKTVALYESWKESGFFDDPDPLLIPLHVEPGTHKLPALSPYPKE